MKLAVRLLLIAVFGFAVIYSSGCATILNDNPQRVVIKTTPSDAEIYVDGEMVGTGTVEQFLAIEREHYIKAKLGDKEQTVTVMSNYGIIWVVADVVFGLLPFVVDFITDDWKELDVPPSGEIHIELK